MKVLVVDDEATIRTLLGRFLEANGHQALFAENGQQALGLVRQEPAAIDAIFCDVRMPVMDGLEFIRCLRQEGLTIPVILVSGQIALGKADATQAGACGILHKPFRLGDVDAMLRSAAPRSGRQDGEARP